jgi:hypothetical protein
MDTCADAWRINALRSGSHHWDRIGTTLTLGPAILKVSVAKHSAMVPLIQLASQWIIPDANRDGYPGSAIGTKPPPSGVECMLVAPNLNIRPHPHWPTSTRMSRSL